MVHKSMLSEVSKLGQIMVDTKLRGAGATVPHCTIPFVCRDFLTCGRYTACVLWFGFQIHLNDSRFWVDDNGCETSVPKRLYRIFGPP